MVVLISKDLFFMASIRAALESAGGKLLHIKEWDAAKITAPKEVVALIVDLSAIKLDSLPELAQEARIELASAQLVAFGPHVHANRLEAAVDAGFDQVLSRGQFSNQIASLVAGWAAS